jgi:hypothetical protein
MRVTYINCAARRLIMKNLINCSNCGARISDTAIRCPICLKETSDRESLSKKIGLSAVGTAGLLLTGPAGIAAALIGGIFDFSSTRQLKKLAKKLGAIDFFDLTQDIWVLVTEDHFVMVLTGAGSSTDFPGFLRSDLHRVYIDKSKSNSGGFLTKKYTVLRLDYFDTNYRKKETSEDYKFKGKNSRAMAEWALVKFKEYQIC